ncbi:MAG: tetratricopeptide repeat protein [Gammaproteobacteria bacterium]
MNIRILILVVALLIVIGPVGYPRTATAQSAVVVGDEGFSRECFQRAELAVSFNAADSDDVEVCSKALDSIHLSRTTRAATFVNRGILQLASGEYEAARASYDAALLLVDDQGETHVNIANMYVHQKRYDDAITEYSKGLKMMKRRQHVAFVNRGLAYEYLKDYDSARRDYEKAVELAPSWIRAKKMLARVKLKQAGRS